MIFCIMSMGFGVCIGKKMESIWVLVFVGFMVERE